MIDGPLVSRDWLQDHLDDPRVVVAEIAQEADQETYLAGHVPGAQGWYWKDVVWDTHAREFPTPDVLADRLAERGVGDDHLLVLYGQRNQFATYCYWVMTELCGFTGVHVLDGGKVGWEAAGLPLTTAEPGAVPPARRRSPQPERRDRSRIRRDELLRALEAGSPPHLLDARYEEEYDGRRVKPGTGFDHGAERHGHIPGAVNVPYERFLSDEDGTFRPPDELRAVLEEVGATPEHPDLVAYCRLGHRGSLVWFVATQLLDHDNLRVYDGSWTEWGSLVGVPVER